MESISISGTVRNVLYWRRAPLGNGRQAQPAQGPRRSISLTALIPTPPPEAIASHEYLPHLAIQNRKSHLGAPREMIVEAPSKT
jgi:hypothetical protein